MNETTQSSIRKSLRYSSLLTPDQYEVDALAISLLAHPTVQAARAEVIARLSKSKEFAHQFATSDGSGRLGSAVDTQLYGALLSAANNNPTSPKVVASLHPPYSFGDLQVPGCGYGGESPDRIYRAIGVSADYRYEIKGNRHSKWPSLNDFSVESVPAPALFGQAMFVLQAPEDIDVEADGTFTVIADATPANGRRNHLYMPPGTKTILVRDTLFDWSHEIPNEIAVRVIGNEKPAAAPSRDAIAQDAVDQFRRCIDMWSAQYENYLKRQPTNTVTAYERPLNWGKGGTILAINAFRLEPDEALVLTIDPLDANYIGTVLIDPWMASVPYDFISASLNKKQVHADADGSITYVISAKDPGVHNWLDNDGLRDGYLMIRWEQFSQLLTRKSQKNGVQSWALDGQLKVDRAIRSARVLKVDEVAAAVPPGQAKVSPDQRRALLGERAAAFRVRLTGEVLAR